MRTIKHLAFAAMAVSALALAGCGGGGSSSTMVAPSATPTTPPETTTPPAPTPVTLPSDGNAYLAAADLTLVDTTAPISLATGGTHDVGVYTLTCDAGPCEITIEDGDVEATGTVTAAYTIAAMATINKAKMTAMDENSGRSLGMHSALTDKDGDRGQQIIGDDASKGAILEIMRGTSGGAMVTDGQLGGTSGWTTATADSAISGFEGTKLTRKTEKMVVYTDIDAAKHKAFLTAYVNDGTDTTVPKALQQADGTPITGVTVAETTHAVSFTAAAMIAAGNAGLLDPTVFPQPEAEGAGNNKYTYDDGEGAGKKKSSFKGTFHGAPGTYTCGTVGTPAAECVVEVSAPSTSSAPGHTAATVGSWFFTPDADNNPQIVNQDADHMHFGWWVKTPAKAAAEGQYLYDAEMFYGGELPFDNTDTIVALHGDADYNGPAAGLFAVTGENAAHGEFTASATLTAKFGDTTAGTVTGAEGGTISGKIGTFVRDDGVANDWSVTLGAAGIAAAGTDNGSGGGTVTGGSNDNIGAWEFQMYGSGMNNANPTGIAGSFRAAIDKNTAVAGAFAVE